MKKLHIDHITKSFGKHRILSDISFTIGKGKITALTGESGSGKTSLLRIIAGLERPDSGKVLLGKEDITSKSPDKRKIGFVFQNLALFPHMSVAQNIGFAISGHSDRLSRIQNLVALTGLQGLEGRYPHELSGGQQQRVALARALAIEPEVLLMDEPFSNLDELLKTRVRSEIKEIIRKLEITTVIVTHHAVDAFMIADEVVILKEGKILQSGTPMEIYTNPGSQYVSDFFGASVILEAWKSKDGIETSFGTLPIFSGRKEGPFKVFIRPENIEITTLGQNNLSGIVADKMFKGPHEVITIQNGNQSFQMETEHSDYKVGDAIFLRAKEDKVLVF